MEAISKCFFRWKKMSSLLMVLVMLSTLIGPSRIARSQAEFQANPNDVLTKSTLTLTSLKRYKDVIENGLKNLDNTHAKATAIVFFQAMSRVAKSPTLHACLNLQQSKDLKNAIDQASMLNWQNVSKRTQLVGNLLNDKFIRVLETLTPAIGRCGGEHLKDQMIIENNHIDLSELIPSEINKDTSEQLRQCTEETLKKLKENCHPLTDSKEPEPEPGPEKEKQEEEAKKKEEEKQEEEAKKKEEEKQEKEAQQQKEKEKKEKEAQQKTGISSEDATVIGVVINSLAIKAAEHFLMAGVPGAILLAFAIVAEVVLHIAWEESVKPNLPGGSPHGSPGNAKMCVSGTMDSRLPSKHPLMGASYKIGGEPMRPQEPFNSCNCILYRDKPLASTYCKSEDEQKRDCALNPFGPDDAPRRECIALLSNDNPQSLTPQAKYCPFHCPEPFALTAGSFCTCGTLPAFEPASLIQCNTIRCEDGEPVIDPQTRQCGCLSQSSEFSPMIPVKPTLFRVSGLAAGNTIKIRSVPNAEMVGDRPISANAKGIQVTGEARSVGSAIWIPIKYQDNQGHIFEGWINSRFLEIQ